MSELDQKIHRAIEKCVDYWNSHIWPGTLFVFLFVFFLYASLYMANPGIYAMDDHFFHFKLAYLIRTQGWDVVLHFNRIAIEPGHSVNYQLALYNLALIPFTYIKDAILGLTISDIFWGSLSVSLVYFAFRKFKMRYSMLWMLILISLEYYMDRMLTGRALVLVPGLVMLELYFATAKKQWKFFLVSALHVAWHPASFFFPLAIALIVEAARSLDRKKPYWWNILAAIGAFFVGINLTLYKITYLLGGIFNVQLSAAQTAIGSGPKAEGAELYPVDIFAIFSKSEFILLALVVCFFAVFFYYIRAKKTQNTETSNSEGRDNVPMYAAFLFTLMVLAGSMIVSGRFFDFYFVAVVFMAGMVLTRIAEDKMMVFNPSLKKYIFFGIVLFFMFVTTSSFLDRRQQMARTDYRPIGEVASWIAQKSKTDDRVFLSDWSYFTVAFFYDSKNVYTMGIEPQGALATRPDLYWKWYNMFAYGIYCDQPEDCSLQKQAFDEKMASATDDEKQQLQKENSAEIINSITHDFQAHYVLSMGALSSIIKLNPDMIADQTSVKSDLNNSVVDGFELK